MGNLSSAIIEARKRHEAEIAERLKRRQMRQRAEVERLNASAVGEPATTEPPNQIEQAAPEVPQPRLAAVDAAPQPSEPPPPSPIVEPPPARPVRTEPRTSKPTVAPAADEVETLPDGRFLRVRNDIIDRIKPFLTGNQFAVYMEVYRQTVGRGKTSGWFRTRDIQTACNLGSDNTVRDAYPVLEQKRLIRLDPNRRIGSPKGLHVTVLSVERALERLERGQAVSTPTAMRAARPALVPPEADETGAAAVDDAGDVVQVVIRKYGVTPTVAPQLVDLVRVEDRDLLPYLFARLDRSIASGKVHNPAGLLRVWLESFDAWRPELVADRERDEEARRLSREAESRDELMVEWFKETEARVQERYDALDPTVRVQIEARGREELLARSPSVRTWTDQQWQTQLATFVKSELRRELEGFDAWLQANGHA